MDLDIIDFFLGHNGQKKKKDIFGLLIMLHYLPRKKKCNWQDKFCVRFKNAKKSCNSLSIHVDWFSKPICAHISSSIIQRQSVFFFFLYQIVFLVRPKTSSKKAHKNVSFCSFRSWVIHVSSQKTLSSLLQHLSTLKFLASARRSKMRSNLDENVSLSTSFFNCFFDFMRKKF